LKRDNNGGEENEKRNVEEERESCAGSFWRKREKIWLLKWFFFSFSFSF